MKDYYEILDVPLTATREQIKSQYKQLVRIYHPDRFRDASEKVQAEEKLKQINIAFQVLSGKSIQAAGHDASLPLPVVYPPVLDFGPVMPNTKSTLSLQLNNLGGPVNHIALRFNGDSRLFQISKGKRVYGDRAFPLNYAVSANTYHLAPETTHAGWLEIDLDGVTTQVELALRINTPPAPQLTGNRGLARWQRWVVIVLVVWFFGLLGAAIPVLNPEFAAWLMPTIRLNRALDWRETSDESAGDATVEAAEALAGVSNGVGEQSGLAVILVPTFTPLPAAVRATDTPIPLATIAEVRNIATASPTLPATAVIDLARTVMIRPNLTINARHAPQETASIVAVLVGDTTWPILQSSPDGQWVQLLLPDGLRAWVPSAAVSETAPQ